MYFPVSEVISMRCVAIFLICLVHATLITSAQAPVSRASAGHGKVDLLGITGAAKGSCCGGESLDASLNTASYINYDSYTLAASYYTLNDKNAATLMLNNKGPVPILATPRFYSLAGERLTLAPITVPGASYIDVDLHQLLAEAGEQFREGSVKVIYQGIETQLGAQIRLVDQQSSLIWAEQFVYPSKLTSSKLEGVWWLPSSDANAKFVITNTTYSTVSVTVKVDGTSPQQSSPVTILLNPSESRVLNIFSDLIGDPNGTLSTRGGISVTHTGQPGAVIARMLVGQPSTGFSSSVQFIDPDHPVSRKWHGNGLRLRNLNGDVLKATVVARNTSAQNTTIRGKIPYTLPDGEIASATIPDTPLPANSTRAINLHGYVTSARLPASVTYAGIELEYDSAPGTVITSVLSRSEDGNHVFQVPMHDPQKMPSSAGGFPWKADGDYRTLVYIKNETDTPKQYIAHLLYEGGGYSLGIRAIKPGQTVAIDFKELRDSQTPGSVGEFIPLNLTNAQIAWSVKGGENKVLSGRSEQISHSGGIASTYACWNCCPDNVYQTSILPSSMELDFGVSGFLQGVQTDMSCYSTLVGPYTPSGVFWNSDNINVVSVFDGELFTEGVGTATISATWDTCLWWVLDGNCDPVCDQTTQYAPVAVRPRIDSVSPEKGSVGGIIDVSIDGAGFASGATVDSIPGIAISNVTVHGSSQISARLTIGGAATGGANEIKVTVNGKTSNPEEFTVQIPKRLRRDVLHDTVVIDPNHGNILNPAGQIVHANVCGAYRNLEYTVLDESDDELELGHADGITLSEILSNYQSSPKEQPPPVAKSILTNDVGEAYDVIAAFTNHPDCPTPFSFSLTQEFKVAIGTANFPLTTKNSIAVTKSSAGTWTINITNVTP